MQNKKLLAVLATIALAAPVLAGCTKTNSSSVQPESSAEQSSQAASSSEASSAAPSSNPMSSEAPVSSSSEEPDYPPVSRISVTNKPDYFVEGKTYNLDDYVSIVGGEGEKVYTVEVKSPETAYISKAEPHKVQILSEGEVKLTIHAGSNDKQARIEIPALSEVAALYDEATKEVSNAYTVYEIDEEGELDLFFLHNTSYCFSPILLGVDHPKGYSDNNFLGGGLFALRNNNLYAFNLYQGNEFVLSSKMGAASAYNNYNVGYDYDLNTSVFETDYDYEDENGENIPALHLSRQSAVYDWTAFGTFFDANFLDEITFSGSDKNKYCVNQLWMYPYVTSEGKEVWYMDMQLAKAATPAVPVNKYMALAISFNEDDYTDAVIEDYIANGALPETVNFDELKNGFDAIASGKNYTIQTDITICPRGQKDNETTQFDGMNYWLKSDMTATTRVTENGFWTTYKNQFAGAYYNKGGKVYNLGIDENTGAMTEPTATTLDDIWNSTLTCGALAKDSPVYDTFEAGSKTVDGANVTIETIGDDAVDFIDVLFGFDVPGQNFADQCEYMMSNNGWDNPYTIFDVVIYITPTTIDVELSCAWATGDDGVRYYGYIDYLFKDFGTTAIPELDSYLA